MIAKNDYTAGLVDIRSGYGTNLIAHISVSSKYLDLKKLFNGKPNFT